MKLIVGLGNPGEKYAATRHNIGFVIIDEVAKKLGVSKFELKFKGYYTKVKYKGEDIILLKPQTYMNLSGESVGAIINYFKIDLDDVLIVYDDLDLTVGKIRFKAKSSNGGHNGIKSIEQHLKTSEFKRLKFGIDRDSRIPVKNYVVSKFTKTELDDVIFNVEIAANACLDFVVDDFITLMNKYN